MDPQGFTTDAISLDMTVGEAAILDLSDVPDNTAITGARIAERIESAVLDPRSALAGA